MKAPRPRLWLLKRPVGEALEAEVGHVVVVLEEESLLARVVGALAEGGRLPARVVPRQVAVPESRDGIKLRFYESILKSVDSL